MKVKVFAKLNLTLFVYERQGAFHPIDSVATSVDVCDVVEVTPRCDTQVNVCGVEGVEMQCNTAYKAAVAFGRMLAHESALSPYGVNILIKKGIPFGAGLGGSSADAAAVVYCMCKLFNVDIHSRTVHDLCATLGSDVNYMLFGGLGRLQGKGDDVTFYRLNKPLYFALTTFDVSMGSGEIYSAFDAMLTTNVAHDDNDTLLNLLQQGANDVAVTLLSNQLQPATLGVNSYAQEYLTFTQSHNLQCNMTGSGSAYYVACQTYAEAQCVAHLLNARGFTTTVCKSVPRGIVEE